MKEMVYSVSRIDQPWINAVDGINSEPPDVYETL